MDQIFLTVRCVVQCSFMATLGVASVFVRVDLIYDQDGELEDAPPPTTTTTSVFFFGLNLDYLDFSGGIFDLLYLITIMCELHEQS